MLSKNKIKYIQSLDSKKKRQEEGLFVAEGPKLVGDLLGHFPCTLLAGTAEWWEKQASLQEVEAQRKIEETAIITPEELTRASLQQHPQQVIALFRQSLHAPDRTAPMHSLCLALDGIQDPGNLGTIIRLADWFGIEHLFCSPDTVDTYNPKVVQATMGALARVKVHYLDLPGLARELAAQQVPVYGTFLEGESVYTESLTSHGLLVMGNEGNGVSAEVAALVSRKLYIPPYPANRPTSESLNVAIATSILCAEFRRRG